MAPHNAESRAQAIEVGSQSVQAWGVQVSETTNLKQVLTNTQCCDAVHAHVFKVWMPVLGQVHLLGQSSGLYKEDRVLFAVSENVHDCMWRMTRLYKAHCIAMVVKFIGKDLWLFSWPISR